VDGVIEVTDIDLHSLHPSIRREIARNARFVVNNGVPHWWWCVEEVLHGNVAGLLNLIFLSL